MEWESPCQGSPRGNAGNQEGIAGASTGVPHLALHRTPARHPQSPAAQCLQKLASEARNTAAAPTSAGGPMRPRGWRKTRRKGCQEEPSPNAHTPCHLDLAPTPTWATVPSQTVALGSGVEDASSSHSGVQMFPGEILGEGEEPGVSAQTLLLGLTHCLPSPPGAAWNRSPVDSDAILTLFPDQGLGHSC